MTRRNGSFSDGGTWTRPRDDGRGRSSRELRDRASYDQESPKDCLSSLLFLSILATTAVAAVRKGRA